MNRPALLRSATLFVASATLAAAWLVLLPWVARQATVADRLRLLDQKRIDASALYYTELRTHRASAAGLGCAGQTATSGINLSIDAR